MTTVNLSSLAGSGSQFFDNSGVPLSGGLIYTYTAGGTTPLVTYTSSTGLTAHPNPIVLDSAGRVNEIWIAEGTSYKFVVKTSVGVTIGTFDNLFPIASLPVSVYNGGTGATTAAQARTNLGLSTLLIPSGTIAMWPTVTPPTDWLLCDGTAVSRTTYSTLFVLFGTTFGAGNGSTTFNLPNYKNRMPYGADTVALGATGGSANSVVVSHTHTATSTSTSTVTDPGHFHASGWSSGGGGSSAYLKAQNAAPEVTVINTSTQTTGVTVATATATTNTTEGVSGTGANLPPYLAINFIIKT
jgi:microcystin-dependent protein